MKLNHIPAHAQWLRPVRKSDRSGWEGVRRQKLIYSAQCTKKTTNKMCLKTEMNTGKSKLINLTQDKAN